MSRERRAILEMLAEGRVTVEEAERLLDALEPGETGGGGASTGGRRQVRVERRPIRPGRGVRRSERRRRAAPLVASGGVFVPPEEADLVVWNSRRHPGGGSIDLRRGGAERGAVESDGPFEVLADDDLVFVEWEYGDVRVAVPDGVVSLRAETNGGDIHAGDLAVPLDVLTQGGDLHLSGVCRSLTAVTMGGNVWIALDALDPESRSEVTTNAGDLFVTFGPEFSGVVKASTLRGDILVADGLGRVFDAARRSMPSTVTVEVGDRPLSAEVLLRTLAGNVHLERRG